MKILLGVCLGAIVGSLMGYYGKCHSGLCPLTSNPFRGALYGAFLGFVFTFSS